MEIIVLVVGIALLVVFFIAKGKSNSEDEWKSDPISDKQYQYVRSLRKQIHDYRQASGETLRWDEVGLKFENGKTKWLSDKEDLRQLSKGQASMLIDSLIEALHEAEMK